jgi:hypothetical protein
VGGDLGGDGKWVDASRRNWKAPDNKLLEILFMFTGNFVHVHWKFFYWKFCSCLLEILFMFTGKKKKCWIGKRSADGRPRSDERQRVQAENSPNP